ncbi:DUF3526 domain-containing protein [Arcicella sp. LKC2W]|uniref:DUF3526 domain-containing protein n=1 Tax=Arcicella sp. LKC2W TaxID=2984198 RepID=UPI002B1FD7E7|nr:DUF3526 domain-containing protein [Arcicella sp. LKC2W]MEA5460892.1 DUF3526 domain-containing protein [Arcicella sp. LKC2W]
MITLMFKNFLRSNSVKIGVLFLLFAGIVSIFVGRQFLDKQHQSILATATYQKQHLNQNVKFHHDEMGLLLYYAKFSLINNTLPISALSIGQRDINPSIQSITIRGLEAQKYDSDLNNPINLLLGNIDYSFVLIFLFPLIIIAFTYNIISEEKESGTWKIVFVQCQNYFLYVCSVFYVRFFVIVLILIISLLLAVFFLQIPLNTIFFTYFITSLLYVIFWFGVCFWVVSLHKNSNYNAILLLSLWLLLIIILPAIINNYLVNKYPTPESFETTLKQRKSYHEKWDVDKKTTINKFYGHYPQYRKFAFPDAEFSWLWYYAMQQMGDDESAKQVNDLNEKLKLRNRVSADIALFIPTLHLQIQFNELAKSGLENHLYFLEETSKFHEKLRLYFYPKIFNHVSVQSENWNKFKVAIFTDIHQVNPLRIFLPLVFFILLFIGMGWVNFYREVGISG